MSLKELIWMLWPFAFLLVLYMLLAGCATDPGMVDRTVGASQPIEYKQGFRAGCDSGYVAAGHPYYRFSKDVVRYQNNDLYRQGWNDGFSVCKGKYDGL